jgi:hypothetical protein
MLRRNTSRAKTLARVASGLQTAARVRQQSPLRSPEGEYLALQLEMVSLAPRRDLEQAATKVSICRPEATRASVFARDVFRRSKPGGGSEVLARGPPPKWSHSPPAATSNKRQRKSVSRERFGQPDGRRRPRPLSPPPTALAKSSLFDPRAYLRLKRETLSRLRRSPKSRALRGHANSSAYARERSWGSALLDTLEGHSHSAWRSLRCSTRARTSDSRERRCRG